MGRIVIFFTVVFLTSTALGQWKKIADFDGEYITCVYFLDLPGPPRIGFVGTESELYKTTNGGQSWTKQWGRGDIALYYVTGICFKDSLTGWFTMFGDTDACYRTTDGGNNWNEINKSSYGALGVDYDSQFNRLFLSLANYNPTSTLVSSDLGSTWAPLTISQTIEDSQTIGITFLSDSIGIASWSALFPDTTTGFLHTTNGGLTWTLGKSTFACEQVLGIMSTPICFAATYPRITVWHSVDYGNTWSELYDFGPFEDSNFNLIGPTGTGYIKGDLNRLYIQTDSGMYISPDSGMTWQKDEGPSYDYYVGQFFASSGVTIAGMTYTENETDHDGGLWEEIWPQAGVAEQQQPASELMVFPNPATNAIQFTPATGEISILDPLGRIYALPRTGNTLDISSLPSGVYFVIAGNVRTKFVKE